MGKKTHKCKHCGEVEVNSIRACEGYGSVDRQHYFVPLTTLERVRMYPPGIVAVEGTDAAGKATQTKILADAIGGEVVSFPDYTTPTGRLIKSHLMGEWQAMESRYSGGQDRFLRADCDALVFQSLYTVNRLEVLPRIMALRAAGRPVVLDRYWLSGVVYGGCDGLDPKWLEDIHASLPQPDLWILLDVDAEESVRRRPERRDRYEKQAGLMERTAETYRRYFRSHDPRRWSVVDGRGDVATVSARVLVALDNRIDLDDFPG